MYQVHTRSTPPKRETTPDTAELALFAALLFFPFALLLASLLSL